MFDSLYQNETDQALRFEAATPRTTPKEKPGVLVGTGTAVVSGLQQGALETGRAGVNAAVAAWRLGGFDRESRGKDLDARLNQPEPELARELGAAARKWDPDPQTMGAAAQVVQQFARVGGKAAGYMMTGGPLAGAAALGVDEGVSEGLKLSDKGVDPATAAQAGAVHGLMTAAGAALPVAGASVAATVGLAAVGGPASFMAEQAAIREILRGADYQGLAAEYDPFDLTGLAVSAGVALTFGAAAQALRAKPKAAPSPLAGAPEEVVDAARVALLDQHDMDVVLGRAKAEGKPVLDALAEQPQGRTEAADRIERGEPIVSRETAAPAQLPEVIDALARQSDEVAPAPARAAEAAPPVERTPEAAQLPQAAQLLPEQRDVETRFANQIAADPEAAMRAYDALPEAQGGRVLNTDVARELSPDYLANPTVHSASVHEPASWLIERKFAEALAKQDEHNFVTFLAGGGGSGKGSAIELLADTFARSSSIVDATLSKLSSAVRKIDATLAAGKGAEIIMVLREPVDAMLAGVVPRAQRTGRVVPLKAFIDAHEGAAKTIKALSERYKDDPRVNIRVIDNRGGPGEAKIADLSVLDQVDYNGLEGRVLQALEADRNAGRVPEEIFNAIVGRPAEGSGGARRLDGRQGGGSAEQVGARQAGRPGEAAGQVGPGAAGAEDPAVSAARAAIESRGDFDMRLEDGTVIKASEALRMAEDAVRQAEADAGAFQAAVACFLRG